MMLPLSILILLSLHYSMDRSKVLSSEANQRLQRELKRLDDNIVEFCRTRLIQWQAFSDLAEVKTVERAKMKETFESLFQKHILERAYLVDAAGNVLFDQDRLFEDTNRKGFAGELGKKAIEFASIQKKQGKIDLSGRDVLSRGFVNRIAGQRGQLHQVVWPGSNSKVYVFLDLVEPSDKVATAPNAIVVTMDKLAFDREYLVEAIRIQQRRDPDLRFFALNREDIADAIPVLKATFKANLLPMISIAQLRDSSDAEQVTDEEKPLLVSMNQGRLLEDYLLGASLDWNQVMESISIMYLNVGVALIISLMGSLTLAFLLARGVVNPIAILSQGTRAIASGDLTRVLPVIDKDELGDLSQAFNDMTKRLRNRLTELTVLYSLTQKASTSHNQREVFELAAKNLKEHLGAIECGTAWINEGEGKENLYLAEIRDPQMGNTIRKAMGEAIQKRKLHFGPLSGKDSGGVLGIPLFFEENGYPLHARTGDLP